MNFAALLKESKHLQNQKEDEHTWQKIDTNLLNLASVAKKNDAEVILVDLQSLLTRSILSERSKVSGTALILLKVCIKFETKADLNPYVDPLFKLCGRSNRVFSMRGEETLLLLADKIPKPMAYFKEYSVSTNKNVRLCAFKTMEVFLRGVSKAGGDSTKVDDQVGNVLAFVESGLSDAHYDCRLVCKRIMKERGNDVEIREDKGPVTIRRPHGVSTEKLGTFAAIGQKAKAAIELLGRYSPFRKQSKTNDNKAKKIEAFQNNDSGFNKINDCQNKDSGSKKTEDYLNKDSGSNDIADVQSKDIGSNESIAVKNLIKMSETKPCDVNNHTPKKLQDYIDKYKDQSFVEKKYLERDSSLCYSGVEKTIENNLECLKDETLIFEKNANLTDNLIKSDEKRNTINETHDLIYKTEPNSSVLGNMGCYDNLLGNVELFKGNDESVHDSEVNKNIGLNCDYLEDGDKSVHDSKVDINCECPIKEIEPVHSLESNGGVTQCQIKSETNVETIHFPLVVNDPEDSFVNHDELSVLARETENNEPQSSIDASVNKLSIHDSVSVAQSIIKNQDGFDSIVIDSEFTVIQPKVYTKRENVIRFIGNGKDEDWSEERSEEENDSKQVQK